MAFNSLAFLAFFPLVVGVFYALPHRWRWPLLLVASYGFYMGRRPEYALLLLFVTATTFVAAQQMARREGAARRWWLAVSLAGTLGVLAVFKYLDFALGSIGAVTRAAGFGGSLEPMGVLLPLGISFFTFQALGYAIDVYRGSVDPERRFGVYALYVSFFPQLVAGPIERSKTLLPQLTRPVAWDDARVGDGLRRMGWGFFKKLVVADRLALYVDAVYGDPTGHSGATVLVASYLFAFQLYYDFSAYSDIAIGAARILGIDLMENFRRPFRARSIGEMWQRWHISLTTWFRDYLYIPLARRRRWRANPVLDFFPLFVLIGLWHGASWTFVVFGALHAVYMATGLLTARARARVRDRLQVARRPRVLAAARVLVTFHLLVFSVVFFRAESLAHAGVVLANVADPRGWLPLSAGPLSAYQLTIALASILLVEYLDWAREHGRGVRLPSPAPLPVRWAGYYGLAAAILMFGVFGTTEFIYFEF